MNYYINSNAVIKEEEEGELVLECGNVNELADVEITEEVTNNKINVEEKEVVDISEILKIRKGKEIKYKTEDEDNKTKNLEKINSDNLLDFNYDDLLQLINPSCDNVNEKVEQEPDQEFF